MATISQILPVKWPDAKWSILEDDYSTLRWESRNIPKPDEADIRAFSDEIDTEREKRRKDKAREDKVLKKPGDIVDAIDTLARSILALAASIDPAATPTPADFTDLNALIARLDAAQEPPGNSGGQGGGQAGGNPNAGDGNPTAGNPNAGNPNAGGGNAGGNNPNTPDTPAPPV